MTPVSGLDRVKFLEQDSLVYLLLHTYSYIETPLAFYRPRVVSRIHDIFHPRRMPRDKVLQMLDAAFSSEVDTEALINGFCSHLMNAMHEITQEEYLVGIYLKLALDLWNIFICRGPENLRRAASAEGNLEKIISSIVLACQREMCHFERLSGSSTIGAVFGASMTAIRYVPQNLLI